MSSGQTPMEIINQAEGRSITGIVINAIGGWLLALGLTAISGLQTVAEFLSLPFVLLIDVGYASVNSFIIGPIEQVVGTGVAVTANEIQLFGIVALPFSVLIVLATLTIVILYLQLEISSNIIPGFFVDNRIVDLVTASPEEEAQGEE